eukprot:RCo051859
MYMSIAGADGVTFRSALCFAKLWLSRRFCLSRMVSFCAAKKLKPQYLSLSVSCRTEKKRRLVALWLGVLRFQSGVGDVVFYSFAPLSFGRAFDTLGAVCFRQPFVLG